MYQKKVKIGLLGGSFNPAHMGHLHISRVAYKKLGLKQIWWVVSPQNPLKQAYNSTFEKRLSTAKEISQNTPYIKVTDVEKRLSASGGSFTINLIRKLKQRYKHYEFYFIIGEDNLSNFDKWHKWRELINEVQFVCISREGGKYTKLNSKAYKTGKIIFIHAPLVKISSTQIRLKN